MRTKRFFTLALVWLVVTCAVTYGQKPFSAILAGASYIPENVENDRQERLTLMNGGTLKAFNVVCGSSDNVKEANKLCKKLVSKGYSAQVTQNQEIGKYRVIAASFNDRDLAVQARNKLRSAYPDAWLLYNVHPTMASSSSSSTPSLLSNLTFEAPKKIIRPTGEWVNIRTAPSTSAPKARIPGTDFTKGASKYDLLPVEDENAGWYRIGRNEWISKQVTRPALCKPITDAMLNRFFGYSEGYDYWAEWIITPVANSDFYLMYLEAPMTLYLGKLVGNVFVFKYSVILDVAKYEEKCRKNREIGKLGGRPRKNQTDSTKTERLNKKPNGLFDNQMVSEKPYPNPNNNPNNNPKEDNSKAKRFIKPTLQEIEQCIKEKGYNIDAGSFYDYYEANGWVQGQGKPIKNWKAALSTWNRRSEQFVSVFQGNKNEKMESPSNGGTFKTTL